MRFEYLAINETKEEVQDTIDAETVELAIFILFQRGLTPIWVQPLTSSAAGRYAKLAHLRNIRAKLSNLHDVNSKSTTATPHQNDELYLVFIIIILVLVWFSVN